VSLVKNSLGVNFTNIFCSAFTWEDPKSAKKTYGLTVFFELLESGCVKAALKMMLK